MSAQMDDTRPAWTPQADAAIRATYGTYPARRIAQHLGVRTMQVVGRAKALGLVAPVVWSDREDRLIRDHYRGGDSASIAALVELTGKARHQVRQRARTLGLARVKPRPWTDADTELLSILWGRKPDRVVAKRLGRTVEACDLRAQRALGRCRLDGVQGWTARAIARKLGVDEHKVLRQWLPNGWLVAKDAPFAYGKHRVKVISEESLLRFLRERPEEYDWRKMADPSGYYQRIAKEAWEAAGLLPIAEAARRVGMSVEGLRRHVRQGWLPGIYGHTTGGAGVLYVRAADLVTWKPRRPELVGHRGRGKAAAS